MKPGTLWIAGVVAILGATVIGNIAVMRIANSDPSFAIESDYYKKAVEFDSTLVLERSSATLGWVAAAHLVHDSTARVNHLVVRVSDKNDTPLVGLVVNADALYNARANDVVHAVLMESEPGVYAAPIAVTNSGEWEVRIHAARADTGKLVTHFYSTSRIEVPGTFVSPPDVKVPGDIKVPGALVRPPEIKVPGALVRPPTPPPQHP